VTLPTPDVDQRGSASCDPKRNDYRLSLSDAKIIQAQRQDSPCSLVSLVSRPISYQEDISVVVATGVQLNRVNLVRGVGRNVFRNMKLGCPKTESAI
jgi:hypothetical protein